MTNWLTSDEINSMRDTVLSVQLDHVCNISRNVEQSRNAFNQPVYALVSLYSGLACHYWEQMENEMVGAINVTLAREHIVLPAETDVTTHDIVILVSGYGTTLGPLDILEVMKRVNHVECIVKGAG